jgi:hypothetical protein
MEADVKTTMTKSMAYVALVLSLILWAGQAVAAPPFVVPQGPPVWCFGLNEFDQCVLYLGNAQTCQNLAPCSDASLGIPTTGLTFCFGADDVTGECKVFLGSRESCDSLEPCRAVSGQLPRAGKLGAR